MAKLGLSAVAAGTYLLQLSCPCRQAEDVMLGLLAVAAGNAAREELGESGWVASDNVTREEREWVRVSVASCNRQLHKRWLP
eukprot:1158282-Pelagomonas_calceolata.AAC.4